MTITEFLEARIEEDEALARDRPNSAQIHYSGCYYYNYSLDANWECDCDEDGEGTKRLLAECAAKRAIVKSYRSCQHAEAKAAEDQTRQLEAFGVKLVSSGMVKGMELAVKHLASAYHTHPEYERDWADELIRGGRFDPTSYGRMRVVAHD